MSLQTTTGNEIPTETIEVANAAFPQGNIYMKLREEFGIIFADQQFEELYPKRGQPAETPWRLATVTILHHGELDRPSDSRFSTGKDRLEISSGIVAQRYRI